MCFNPINNKAANCPISQAKNLRWLRLRREKTSKSPPGAFSKTGMYRFPQKPYYCEKNAHTMRTTILLLVSLSLISAQKCKKTSSGGSSSPLVEMHTGACFGYCPVFTLTALNNGLVRYNGERFVEKIGKDSFNLSAEELKKLQTKVKEVNLWQYPDMIKTDVVDAPFVTLTAFDGDKSKSVRGSFDRPAPLLELEGLLKDLAEAHGFEVKRGVNPNNIPETNRREVIVKLKPELNAGNWIRQISEFRLQLVRRVSAENIWRVAYDTKQIDEKAVIEMLKNTDGVLDVQPNNKAEERN